MSEDNTKLTKPPTFDGKESNFPMWWTKFNAHALMNHFKRALVAGGEADMPAAENTPNQTDAQKKAVARNDVAVAQLSLAFTTHAMMRLILQASTIAWPSGHAGTVK